MASEEDVKIESCVHDPDFAVICSFFENFSSLCGIQSLTTAQLQQMIDDTKFTAPELIDLHIRLMRKAKKNVNPDRWQKTLAKFCYYSLPPEDCWILEQKGYQHLNYSQRLKFLSTLIGAQFDLNAKFKADVNKLDVRDLRLEPLGRDKDGNNYWVHMDRETTLKIYKEDLDEEKWELIVEDREGLVKLLENLIKDKDPNRELAELAEESESSSEEEDQPEADAQMKDENVEKDKKEEVNESSSDEGEGNENEENASKEKIEPAKQGPAVSAVVPKPIVKEEPRRVQFAEKLQQALSEGPLKKSSISLISRPRCSYTPTPMKPLNKEAFTQHLQRLDSINMLKPLLTNTEPGDELNPAAIRSDLLKTKINQKFSIIKPGLQTDIVKSKLEPSPKPAKPGLKLEQILKSKLAQKLSGASALAAVSTKEANKEEKKPVVELCKETREASEREVAKRISDPSNSSEEQPAKRSRLEKTATDDDDREIEEPVMVVNGVGSGQDCQSCYDDEDEIEEEVMFFSGVGSGAECTTGNNENDESAKNSSHTLHLTHKVDNMLKPPSDSETPPSTSASETAVDTEKKKPKLWTIDAICNSDSSKESKRDSVSQFPNFSFNKDTNTKPYHSASESYSIFSLTENKESRDAATVIPTNFYFGSNNQNPCFLPAPELSSPFKTSLHSVENIVENVNKVADAKVSKFSAENLYSKTNNVNDVEKVERVPSVGGDRAPEIDLQKAPEIVKPIEVLYEPAVVETCERQSESKIIDSSSPQLDETVTAEPHVSSDSTSASEDVLSTSEAPASLVGKCPDPVVNEIPPLPPSPVSLADVRPSSPLKEVESTPPSTSNSEAEPELLKVDQPSVVVAEPPADLPSKLEPVSVDHDEKLEPISVDLPEKWEPTSVDLPERLEPISMDQKERLEPTSIDQKEHVPESNSAPPSPPEVVAAADPSSIDKVENEIKIVEPEVEPSSNVIQSSEPIQSPTETAPTLSKSENTHPEPEIPVPAPTEVVDSVKEPGCKTIENPLASVPEPERPQNSFDTPPLDDTAATLPVLETHQHSKLDETSEKNEHLDESAINETKDVVAKEPVLTVVEESLPSIIAEVTTADQHEVIETTSTETETYKTDNEQKATDNEVQPDVGTTTEPKEEQLTGTKDEAQIEKRTDQKEEVTEKKETASEEVAKVEVQAQETPPNATVENKVSEQSTPVRKETRKGKQKEASAPVLKNDVQKKEHNEVDVAVPETRRSTRSSRARKSEVEVVNESVPEKGKKWSKNNKLKAEKEDVDVTATAANESADKPKKWSRNTKQKNEKNDAGATTNENVQTTAKKSLRNTKQKNAESVEVVSENVEKAKKSTKDVKQNSEPAEKTEPLKITIKTSRGRSNNLEKEVVKTETSTAVGEENEVESNVENEEVEDNDEAEAEEAASDNEETPKTEATKKPMKRGRKKKRSYVKKPVVKPKTTPKKVEKVEQDQSESESAAKGESNENDETPEKATPEPKKRRKKRGWLNEVDVNNIAGTAEAESTSGIRQSRRIAQLKIKEQAETTKYQDIVSPTKKVPANQKSKTPTPVKKTKATGKGKYKPPKEESDEETYYELASTKKRGRKKKDQPPKKDFDPKKPWKQSASSSSEEEDEEEHYEEEDEEFTVHDKSDHEFSPESDVEDEDYQPVKRARTAHSKPGAEDKSERDDLSCQSCGTADQPEWILLCDSCDEGWHAACLKPPVMTIPEGDWFCPPCQHNKLITSLQMFLRTYDKAVRKRASEESRRKRLEYVNISFSNVIQEESTTPKAKTSRSQDSSSSSDESSEEESEEEEEPLYQLRVRRQVNVRHRLNEYEELMSNAIERESGEVIPEPLEAVKTETSVNGAAVAEAPKEDVQPPTQPQETKAEEKKESEESAEDEEEEEEEDEDEEKEEKKEKEVPIILQLRNVRKKPARLTNLDVSSEEDHYSDEDFKGSSDDQDEDEEYAKSDTDSDEASYRRGRGRREPVRRSTRARRTRYDNDFIDDNSDEDEDDEEYGRKKKKKRISYAESESDEDSTWGRKKRKKNTQTYRAKPAAKKRKRITFDGDSDEDEGKKKSARNSRIKYGLDEDEDFSSTRRTRGKKINYQDDLDSEFDEEEESTGPRNKSRKILSDDEYMDEDDDQKDSVASENGEHSESGSESNESEKVQKNKKAKVLESDDSDDDASPAAESEAPEAKKLESPPKTVITAAPAAEPDQKIEPNMVNSVADSIDVGPPKNAVLPNNIVKDDGAESVIQKIDQNPSLQGMQSMAQNLPQHALPPPNHFPPNVHPDAAAFVGRLPPQPPVPVHYELGIRYETPDGMPLPPQQLQAPPGDKFSPHPIRVPSPNKMYGLPPDMQQQVANRPHPLPPFPPQQMQPPIVGPPGLMNVPPLPPTSRPLPSAIPLSQMQQQQQQMSMPPRAEGGRPMPPAIPISQGPMTMPEGSRPMPSAIPISQAQMPLPGSDRPMPSAISILRGPVPMMGPGPRPPMHMQPMAHLVGPPPNVNIAQCGPPPGSMIPPNAMPSAQEATPPPKRRPRGRGKKQLEMERVQRERRAMEASRGPGTGSEEMIPLHVLKMPPPPSEANAAMPPRPGPPPPPFSTYQQQQQMPPFSQAGPPPVQQQQQQQAASVSQKRVKITPTRMRMPTPPPQPEKLPPHMPRPTNPAAAAAAAAGMYPPMRHGLPPTVPVPVPVSSPSSGAAPSPDGKGAGGPPPPPVSGGATSTSAVTTLPTKTTETASRPNRGGGESSDAPQYYQHPPTPYPPPPPVPSQGPPRVYGSRPEYPFAARKPVPPGMYPPGPLQQQPPPGANTAPNVVVSRTGGFAGPSVVGPPPPVSSPGMKSSESATTAAGATTTTIPTVPLPYPGAQYGMPPRPLPTTVVTSSMGSRPGQSGPYIMTTRPLPPGAPPLGGYPLHPHIKPPHSAVGGGPPYPRPPYYSRPPYSSAGGPPPPTLPPSSSPSLAMSQPPPVTFSHGGVATPNFSPNQSRIAPPPQQSPGGQPSGGDANHSLNSTSQNGDYQFAPQQQQPPPPPPANAPSEPEGGASEESAPAEESSGEFGGLVSYFSSQQESDLDE